MAPIIRIYTYLAGGVFPDVHRVLFDRIHHLLPSPMPPRKKVKVDHAEAGAMANTRRATRASNKVASVVVAVDAASNDQPLVASVVPTVLRLRRGCLKEIPNFAVEIQLMVCMPCTRSVSETSNYNEVRSSATYTHCIFSTCPAQLRCSMTSSCIGATSRSG